MSSLNDLLNLLDEVKEQASSGGGFKIVAEAEVNLGFCVFSSPPKMFTYEARNDADKARALNEAKAHAQAEGKNAERIPHGLITTVYGGDRRLTHPESTRIEFDINDFVPDWHAEGKVTLTPEQRKLMDGATMPFDAVVDGIKNAGNADVFGTAKWCMLAQVPDGFRKARGEKQVDKHDPSKEYDWRIHVIEKVYANKAEAVADYESLKRGSSTNDSAVATANGDDDQLSEKARKEGGWTWESLVEIKANLESQYGEAVGGKGINGEVLKAMNPVKAEQYIADNYSIEVDDLKKVFAHELAF